MNSHDIFAVIADDTRRRILEVLLRGDLAVGDVVEQVRVSQPTVSKHLKVLREAGLVRMRAEGQRRVYSVEPAALDSVANWVREFLPAGAQSATLRSSATGRDPEGVRSGAQVPPRPHAAETSSSSTRQGSRAELTDTDLARPESPLDPADPTLPQNIGRTVGRAAERAADLLSHLPHIRRRRE